VADGGTALHIAAAQGHAHAVKFLVERARADVERRDRKGQLAVSVTNNYDIAMYVGATRGASLGCRRPLCVLLCFGGDLACVPADF
jgi:ankyrin repeat protein